MWLVILLTVRDNYPDLDGGLYQTATIGDIIWIDTNGSGVQDPGESGAAGITITIADTDGNPIGSTVSDENGNYLFEVDPGDYIVTFDVPTTHVAVEPNSGSDDETDSDIDVTTFSTSTISVGPDEHLTDIDAGIEARSIDLQLVKTLDGTNPANNTASWNLVVSNTGKHTALGPITITDELPATLSFASASGNGWTCEATGRTVNCIHPDDLVTGRQHPSVTIITTVAVGATDVTNTAVAVSPSGLTSEDDTANNTDSAILTSLEIPDYLASTTSTNVFGVTGANVVQLILLGLGLGIAGTMLLIIRRRRIRTT